jgi:hypothetical protein
MEIQNITLLTIKGERYEEQQSTNTCYLLSLFGFDPVPSTSRQGMARAPLQYKNNMAVGREQ